MKVKSCYEYDYNVTSVKQYGDNIYRVCTMAACRNSGYESPLKAYTKKNTVNEHKLSNNVVRARTTVKEYALCNKWSYFVTLTISPEKYDRMNLKAYYTDLSTFIHNLNRRRPVEQKIKYVLIPELHKDGAWHMHGLIQGLSEKDLSINKNGYFTWEKYNKRFGFMSLDTVQDIDRLANYILKYLTKDVEKSVTELGAHLYYASKGLERAELLYRGKAELHCDYDYEHPDGYCRIKTFDNRKENMMDYLEILE